ncbi:MAG: phosphotransferase [Cyanothece sp. SIO1E1]|nr:phosphotransferase [Cyanothece sp. SIO1E1]
MNKEALQKIAVAVLQQYPQHYSSVTFFAQETSVVFEVVNDKGEAFALKIYDDTSSQTEDNEVEILMIKAIRSYTTISVAEMVNNLQGRPITIYADPSTGATYRIVLSKWLPGADFKGQESEELFIALGQAVADLHQATRQIDLPKELQPKVWNQVFYFRDEEAVYRQPKYESQTSSEFKDLMDEALARLNPRLSQIYGQGEAQLLHGDLNPWNIKVHHGQFSILDFEDAILGPPIQDLAILLYYYQGHDHFAFASIKDWILQGYTSRNSIAGWNDQAIESLIMARQVNFLNYVLTLEGDYHSYLETGLTRLKTFLRAHT